jgi:hypothetical protein
MEFPSTQYLEMALARFVSLKHVILKSIPCLNNKTILGLLPSRASLLSLDISGSYNASIQGVVSILTEAPCGNSSRAMSNLRELNVSGTALSAGSLLALRKCCPSLFQLQMNHCTGLTEEIMNELFDCVGNNRTLPNLSLRHLGVAGTSISNSAVTKLAKECGASIEILEIGNCPNIFGEGLYNAIDKLNNLTHLDIEEIDWVSDNLIAKITQYLPKLTHLNISGCDQVGDTGLITAMKFAKKLQVLNLDGCWRITETFIQTLLDEESYAGPTRDFRSWKNLPSLMRIDLTDCINIPPHCIKALIGSRGTDLAIISAVAPTSEINESAEERHGTPRSYRRAGANTSHSLCTIL